MKIKDLLESIDSRIDWLVKNRSNQLLNAFRSDNYDKLPFDATPIDILDTLKQADPSKKGLYIQWIANKYIAKQFKLEDIPRLKKDLELFDKNKQFIENKDINSYRTLKDFYAAIQPFEDNPNQPEFMSNKQKIKEVKKQVQWIIKTPNFKVLIPKTEQAACYYGANTRWCTAGKDDNQFENYNSKDDIYIIIAGKRKFQLHYADDQFMDETDSTIDMKDINYLSGFPEYKQFLNMLIKKYYSKFFDLQ